MRTSRILATLSGLVVATSLGLAPGPAAVAGSDAGAAAAQGAPAPATTHTTLRLDKEGGRVVSAHVKVRSQAGRPIGRVELREGGQLLRGFRMRRSDEGSRTFTLRLAPGRHGVRAYFLGNVVWSASHSSVRTVRIG